MATTELTERDITKKMLEDAAADMSAVMKFEEAIPTGKKIVKAAIQADVIEAAGELRAEDVLTSKTVEVLTALGVNLPTEEAGKAEPPTETVPDPEPLTENEPAVGELKRDESVNGPDVKKGKGELSGKNTTKVKVKGITRIQAICHTLREAESGIDFESLSAQSDAFYARDGKKSNMVANDREVTWVIQCLDAAGVLNETEGKYSL